MKNFIKKTFEYKQKVTVSILCFVILMLLVGCISSCSNNSKNEGEIFTTPFYVFSAAFDEDEQFTKDEQCGYLLFEELGSPGLFHGRFVWAENLPKEYQLHLLHVIVTYRVTENHGNDCVYNVINIIKIKKQ